MNQSNSTLANRIADLERQLSNTKTITNTLLEENKQLIKQNTALAAQVKVLQRELKDAQQTLQKIAGCTWDSGTEEIADVALDEAKRWVSRYNDSVLKSTPDACLAQVRADAVDTAVNSIVTMDMRDLSNDFIDGYEYCRALMYQYAASIRQEGK